jgi:hypothetical protein
MESRFFKHLQHANNQIELDFDEAARLGVDSYIHEFSGVEALVQRAGNVLSLGSPPCHLALHIYAVLQPLRHRFNTLVDEML